MRKAQTKILPDAPTLDGVSSFEKLLSSLLSPPVKAPKRRKAVGKADVVQPTRQLRRQTKRLREKQARAVERARK